ncbi:MAG: hypothetical protein AAFX93_12030 [Verrucomicrobiota bacterium]
MSGSTPKSGLSELESETIAIFVRIVQLVGLPKSLGQIYGLIYICPKPVSMEELVERLGISIGSASQGLRQLRTFKAISTVYVPGERKDYYTPETEFRKLISNFLDDQLRPHLETGNGAIEHLNALAEASPVEEREHYRNRINKLKRLHKIAGNITPAISKFVNF